MLPIWRQVSDHNAVLAVLRAAVCGEGQRGGPKVERQKWRRGNETGTMLMRTAEEEGRKVQRPGAGTRKDNLMWSATTDAAPPRRGALHGRQQHNGARVGREWGPRHATPRHAAAQPQASAPCHSAGRPRDAAAAHTCKPSLPRVVWQ